MMRRILFLVWIGLVLASSSRAQPLRVVTWKLEDFPLPAPTNNAPPVEVDPKRVKLLAAALKPLEADIIILDGLSDRNLAGKLASQMKPAVYHVANHTHFRNGPNTPVVAPPITILAKKKPVLSRSVEWRWTGQIEAPGGFVFAAFAHGTNTVCVYDAGLPLTLTNRDDQAQEQLNGRHRELAAQYLVHHGNWLASTLTNPLGALVLSGDFTPTSRTILEDHAVRVLEQGSFRSERPGASAPHRGAGADLGASIAPLSPPIFVRNAEFASRPVIGLAESLGTAPVTWDLMVKPPESKPFVVPTPVEIVVATAPAHAMAKLAEDPRRFLWLSGAVVLTTLIGVVCFQWLAWRRWSKSLMPARRVANAVAVDFHPEPATGPRLPGGRRPAGMLKEEEDDGPEAVAWQQRALKAEQRARRATTLAQSGLKPHLLGLMREKLVWWLNSQRSHLLDSHETGTAQVMELEERLERIQAQFRERLVARDQRITELEQEIAAREQAIQGLLKARENPGGPVQASNE